MDNVGVDLEPGDLEPNKEPKQQTSEQTGTKDGEDVQKGQVDIEIEEEGRDAWGNKIEFVLATIGYAVGLGNVWRFPYLCQKNGGGAFLIPYFISLILLGIPLFFLELAIGQRLRKGSIGVWNEIGPLFAGVGITSFMVSVFVSVYYNMIVGWCFYYLFISFQGTLPYQDCPTGNGTSQVECAIAGKSSYYWYRVALDTSPSIDDSGGLQWHLCMVLLLSWLVVFFCTMRGVQSTGKVVYFTATFPYLVLIIFFFRGVTLDGAGNGLKRMFTPQFDKLGDPMVWFEAATQIFYSLGIGFGGLIAMSSYNPMHNNCKRDAIFVSVVNCGTSIFASIVVFSILGFKATSKYNDCLDAARNQTNSSSCASLDEYLKDVAQGPGLTFIAFTEAITLMPLPQIWAVLFFCMLLTLGMGSMFGNFAGVLTPLMDMKMFSIRKEFLAGITCSVCYLIGLLFCLNSGEYWIQMFNDYSISIGLLTVGFIELLVVNYAYGTDKFLDDIQFMTGRKPGWYWIIMWKFIGPPLAFLLLIASVVDMSRHGVIYTTWDKYVGKTVASVSYPSWAVAVIALLILSGVVWIPLVFIVKYFGLTKEKSTQGNSIVLQSITKSTSRQELATNENNVSSELN